ncbi:DNA sulfur modification protein DndB [Metabacillus arenae]|uniref:DGQHR domain-containing protein n=1 Tax=Metabacillus arenae TaxID=2771434 RepID=A0A926NLW8_9BACI|nr:DNA sulfur modification protein DndB [Metabacillus arenae]MBD1383115.1 hypothetical protein [Metabacillus arenae]
MAAESTIEYMSLSFLAKQFAKDQIIIRAVKKEHVQALKRYIISGMETKQAFLPMLVANKSVDGKLQMIDGSTRVYAIHSLYNSLKTQSSHYEENQTKLAVYLENSSIGIQVFQGLSESECDQLYIDFNTRGKKVALSKLIEYDSRNLDNQITNRLIETNEMLRQAGIETEKRAIIRPTNKKFLSLSQLRQVVKIFMKGDQFASIKVSDKESLLMEEEYTELLNNWFYELFKWQTPKEAGNYHITMLASFPVISSIAYFVNDGMVNETFEKRMNQMVNRMQQLSQIDWSTSSHVWESFNGAYRNGIELYFLKNEPATIKQILKWLEKAAFKGVM